MAHNRWYLSWSGPWHCCVPKFFCGVDLGYKGNMKMVTTDKISAYRGELEQELTRNILPFWIERATDRENGGFYGWISNDAIPDKMADKGCILNSRILWTYSLAYRIYQQPGYLKTAARAYNYLVNCFWDPEFSGLYWMVNYRGEAVDTRKHLYNLAFGIYALSEYYRATGDKNSLARAIELFRIIEAKSRDRANKGYFESFSREWLASDDLRMSETDLNAKKSMNTHLHLMEAYTNLLRVWEDNGLRERLNELILIAMESILDPDTYHFNLFFNGNWRSASGQISYGHDIEGSWLLCEAASVLNDSKLLVQVKEIAVKMAQTVYDEGLDKENGGLYYEADSGGTDAEKHWWPQAEAMVGFFNAYELTGAEYFYEASYRVWQFVKKYLIDTQNGEWFSKVSREGRVCAALPKVGPWKCPYHNSRACFELIERLTAAEGRKLTAAK